MFCLNSTTANYKIGKVTRQEQGNINGYDNNYLIN